jgi:hypothetical protein
MKSQPQPIFKFGDMVQAKDGNSDPYVIQNTYWHKGCYYHGGGACLSSREDLLKLYVPPKPKKLYAYKKRVAMSAIPVSTILSTSIIQTTAVRFFPDEIELIEWKRAPEFDIVYPDGK